MIFLYNLKSDTERGWLDIDMNEQKCNSLKQLSNFEFLHVTIFENLLETWVSAASGK